MYYIEEVKVLTNFTLEFYISAATSIMIPVISIERGSDYINLKWQNPRFDPEWYKMIASCTLQCAQNAYLNRMAYQHPSRNDVLFSFSGLLPGSNCFFRLFAVYNFASLDPGLDILTMTKDSGEDVSMVLAINSEALWGRTPIYYYFFKLITPFSFVQC